MSAPARTRKVDGAQIGDIGHVPEWAEHHQRKAIQPPLSHFSPTRFHRRSRSARDNGGNRFGISFTKISELFVVVIHNLLSKEGAHAKIRVSSLPGNVLRLNLSARYLYLRHKLLHIRVSVPPIGHGVIDLGPPEGRAALFKNARIFQGFTGGAFPLRLYRL